MAKNMAYFDLYDEVKFECRAEEGYVNDIDMCIVCGDKQIDLRLSIEQATQLAETLLSEISR